MAGTVWRGHLAFGLVSLPVRLHSAARAATLSFHQLHRTDHSRIKHVLFCQAEDKRVERSEVVRGYEYEKDRYVVIEDEDIRKILPKTAKVMEVLEFVKQAEIDPLYYEASYYLAPDEAGEKPYTLLFEALKRSGYVALAKLTMHNREHIVILRPSESGIVLHTMYYEDELRRTEAYRTDTSMVKEQELSMATMLIESMAAPFEPQKYHDHYRENLRQMIDAKIAGREVVEPHEVQPAKVIDIVDALKASLAALKKPVATEGEQAPKARRAGS
ncbi:MAG: Ku protein [Bryobacteraceae bacterium]|nr:Ku protein [Bryobacteraceae bacterium]MDW8378134.1 Ku protein [Bryobacterales bacterium]